MTTRKAGIGNHQQGFSLVEILITVIVISIGLLGLAALQFAGMRAANNAYEYTLANLLAQDIEERIRASSNPSAYAPMSLTWNGSPPTITKNCNMVSCSDSDMLSFDKWEWYYTIHMGSGHNVPVLSMATISISRSGNNYTVSITWSNNPSVTSTFSL